jgi:hypothetical protein
MSELQLTNANDDKVKRKIVIKNKNEPIIVGGTFITQVLRKDILANMLTNIKLSSGKETFYRIMKDNKETCDASRQGWIYETLCQILIVTKCVEQIPYTAIYDGQLQNGKPLTNVNALLKIRIAGGGNNIVDMTIKQDNTLVLWSIKYKNKYSETDVSKIDNTITKQNLTDDYKIGLVVKDKALVINHKYKNDLNIDKQLHDTVIANGLLLDENDIIKALDAFRDRFSNNTLGVDEFIDFINSEYLLSPRQQLIQKLHQKMSLMKFIKSLLTNKHKMWCIAHKPRSGKSITMLLMCKYLLEHGYNKILIMTSVPATIHSFVNDLEKYIDFKDIDYKLQDKFDTIDETFNGIVFCSVQYLKTNGKSKKKDLLKKMGFDAIITDEAHLGGSTDKTKADILDVDNDVEEIRKNIKLNIFASGTADKTKKYYGIHGSCVFEWEIEDEAYMKELGKPLVKNREEIIEYMANRHGTTFTECLGNETLNKDYSKHPAQVLMKHTIPKLLIDDINKYNDKHGTKFGYSCSSLFALQEIINEKGEVEYAEEFELCKTTDGIEILNDFFDSIISTNRMRNTIMKQIENIQTSRGSRKSTKEKPLLFIMYLPTNTRNNTIDKLHKTLKRFLETHQLWSDYNIEYSNSISDTGNVKEEYNEYIQTIMKKTKKDNQKGCILLLGNKGNTGITYDECDVTFSFDDGHNLDNQKQKISRALTEAEGKTIGINVDMNIQRTYLCVIDIIHKHRKNTKTTKTNAEILYYLYEHNIFLFDPQQFNNGKVTTVEIMSYYQKEAENLMNEIDDTPFLESLICDDDMCDFIKTDFQKIASKKINTDLEGEQQDCPKGDKTKTQIDGPDNKRDGNALNEEEIEKVTLLINQTYEMCKSFLFPLLALLSRSYEVFDFKEIFTNEKTSHLIMAFLKDKKIDLNNGNFTIIINIMNTIIDNNAEIVNNIREIYSIASPNKLRELIEKHFVPTADEKKRNAEVPTPTKLVDEMLNTVPLDFWKKPRKVFEPCCGKGTFVINIFDRFYKGLSVMYPDEIERCRVIMTECIYYADLTALNVFITTEIMKCHVQSWCSLDELDYEFNSYTGDTLKLDIKSVWKIEEFDAVMGNPPYESNDENGRKALNHNLWSLFIIDLFKVINEDGYLLFITPCSWMSPTSDMKDIFYKNYIVHLNVNECEKHFKVGSKFSYYLIQKTENKQETTVVCAYKKKIYNSNILIHDFSFLPNLLCDKSLSILHKFYNNAFEKINFKTTSELHNTTKQNNIRDIADNEFVHPIRHTAKNNIRYSNKKHSLSDKRKILMNLSGNLRPIFDDGELGFTQAQMYLLTDNPKYVEVLNSKLYTFIFTICKWSGFNIEVVFHNIPYINEVINDDELYKLFNITEDESKLIDSIIDTPA